MALDSMDNLRDGMINRGVGNSGLTSQAVGRMNIEELSNLNGALQTSRQTLMNEKQERDAKVFSQVLKDRSLLRPTGGNGTGATEDKGSRFILQVSPGFQNQLRGIPGATPLTGSAPKFSIVGMNPQGGQATYNFTSVDELAGFLEANPNVKETLASVAGDPLQQAFEGSDYYKQIKQIPVQAVGRILGDNGRSGTSIGGMRRSLGREQEAPASKQIQYLQTAPEKFSISELPQNERAKVVSSVMEKVAYYGSPTSPNRTSEGAMRYKFMQEAMKTGKLNQVTEALLRKGVVSYGK